MKATMYDVTVTGTPEEMHKLLSLMFPVPKMKGATKPSIERLKEGGVSGAIGKNNVILA